MRYVVLFFLAAITLIPRWTGAQITAEPVAKFFVPEANAFAASIAVYADTVLIGSLDPQAYVFQLEGGKWWMDRLATVDARGWYREVRLDNDLAIVGAAPYAYLFRFNGSTWSHEATLSRDPPGGDFGQSVDIDGSYAVVGTRSADVQVFRYDGREWAREATLAPPPREDGKAPFGFADQVVVDNERVMVRKSSTIGDELEAVYAFRRDSTGWYHEDTITLHEPGAKTIFQGEIALDGDVALIDADYDDVVHVFRFDGVAWKREAILEPPELDTRTCYCVPPPAGGGERCDDSTPNFGVSVAIDGDLALVGANLDDVSGTDSGAAYLYRYDGTRWNNELVLQAEPSSSCGGNFGRLVALHQGRALVRRGHAVYFFRLDRPGE